MECSRVFHSVTVEGFRNSTIYNSYALHINWKEQNDGNLQKWVSSMFPLLLNYFAGYISLFPRFSFSILKLVKMWIICNNYHYWCQMSDFEYITHQVGNQVPSSRTNTIQQLYCYRLDQPDSQPLDQVMLPLPAIPTSTPWAPTPGNQVPVILRHSGCGEGRSGQAKPKI